MHILATTTASLDDLVEPVDLRQEPADILVLSFTDSDLSALSSVQAAQPAHFPSVRLTALRELRHPMSVDSGIEGAARHAKVIVVRILGGYEWWRYGVDQLAAFARQHRIKLALLPGECRETDERLAELSTLPRTELDALLAYFREGGPDNMAELLKRLASHSGAATVFAEAQPLPKAGYYLPGDGAVTPRRMDERCVGAKAVTPILFYRSMLLASDIAPIDALCSALNERGITPVPVFVSSLKDRSAIEFVEHAASTRAPALMITTTAFSAGGEDGNSLFDRIGVPVFQAVMATTRREAWDSGQRGLAPADLAMHVVLPELDGRILAGAISFKVQAATTDALGSLGQINQSEPDRVEHVADRVAAFIKLQQTPARERRLAILIPDYPSASGRSGYAVGLDVPQSVLAILEDLKNAGYTVENIPETAKLLMQVLDEGAPGITQTDYAEAFQQLPAEARQSIVGAWGEPDGQARFSSGFPRRAPSATSLSHLRPIAAVRKTVAPTITIRPCRRATNSSRSACGCEKHLACHAIVHVGAHGTLGMAAGQDRRARCGLFSRDRHRLACLSSIRSSSAIPARPRRPSAASRLSRSAICRRRWPRPASTRTADTGTPCR
jgi:cobaltochelatase CobN